MKQHSLVTYRHATDLLKRGAKPAQVASALGLPIQTVCDWRDGSIPWHARVSFEPNTDLVYLLGVLFGDGQVHKVTTGKAISLMARDREFVEAFANAAANVFLRPVTVRFNRAHKMPFCRVQSTTFCDWFDRLSPADLENFIASHERDFLRGLFDSDGSAAVWPKGNRINQKVAFYTSDHSLALFIAKMLKGLGFLPKVRSFNRIGRKVITGVTRKIEHHVIIERKLDFERFGREIGSSISRKLHAWQMYFATPEFRDRVKRAGVV